MTTEMRNAVTNLEFIAAIGDIERGDGMILYPQDHRPVRAVFLSYTTTHRGQPGAIYIVPGRARYALIVLDYLTRQPHVLTWLTQEEAESDSLTTPAHRRRRRGGKGRTELRNDTTTLPAAA